MIILRLFYTIKLTLIPSYCMPFIESHAALDNLKQTTEQNKRLHLILVCLLLLLSLQASVCMCVHVLCACTCQCVCQQRKLKADFPWQASSPNCTFGGEFDLARDVTIIFISPCIPLHPHLHTVEIISEIQNPKLTQREKKSDCKGEKIISHSFGR